MLSVIPEAGTKTPEAVNFYFDKEDAMIVYAPNGLLHKVAREIGGDRITSYVGKEEVILSCDRDMAGYMLEETPRNALEEKIQVSLQRFFKF